MGEVKDKKEKNTMVNSSNGKNKIDFIDLLAEFYKKFFICSSDAIKLLANLQNKYSEEYESIRKFGQDHEAIDELIEELPEEKQAILLKILLKAGNFGRDMSNLFDSSEEDKLKLSKDLKRFAEDLEKIMKSEKEQ